MKKYQSFLSENFQFLEMKFSIYLNSRVFVMNSEPSFKLLFSSTENNDVLLFQNQCC